MNVSVGSRCPELAQAHSSVALAWHNARGSTPFGVTHVLRRALAALERRAPNIAVSITRSRSLATTDATLRPHILGVPTQPLLSLLLIGKQAPSTRTDSM